MPFFSSGLIQEVPLTQHTVAYGNSADCKENTDLTGNQAKIFNLNCVKQGVGELSSAIQRQNHADMFQRDTALLRRIADLQQPLQLLTETLHSPDLVFKSRQ